MVILECEFCGKRFERLAAEHYRNQVKRRQVFCSLSCAAVVRNWSSRSKEIVKVCPHCGERFQSSTHNKASTFCSRSCASRGSMTEKRREAQRKAGFDKVGNLLSPEETLKRREAWKYELLREALGTRPHEFEYRLGEFIFDLALLDSKVLVEFDGTYHRGTKQLNADKRKDQAAKEAGFVVVRRSTFSVSAIDPVTLDGL